MRFLRSSLVAASIGSLLATAQLIACGGDDNNAGPVGTDTGTNDAGSTGPVLTISDSRSKVYLGQTAKIDGASVAPNITANAKWVVLAAPSESTIKTESLQGADSTSPSFKPDVLGQYTLQMSGDKDGVSSSVVVLIEAIDAPVFWREGTLTGSTSSSTSVSLRVSTHVGGAYGSRDRVVDCPSTVLEDGGAGSEMSLAVVAVRTASWGDTWEGAPGAPSRVAVPSLKLDPSNGTTTFGLQVATSQSTCNSPDAKVLLTAENDAGMPAEAIWNARFSPDGNRLALMGDTHGAGRIVSIGFDGSAKRELGATQASADGGALDPDASTNLRPVSSFPMGPVTPRWKDNSHVGWVSFFPSDGDMLDYQSWNLYVVEDKDNAQPELAMRCTKVGLQSFDFLADGSIVVAASHEVADGEGTATPMDLLVYRANANKECELVRNLTNGKSNTDVARDLALSPDKTQIAFLWGTATSLGFDPSSLLTLSTVPVDGSSAPAHVPGAGTGAVAGMGPRWVAGGTALTWGHQDNGSSSSGPFPGANAKQVAIPATGGVRNVIAEASQTVSADAGAVEARVVAGIGQGCSASSGALSSGFMTGGVALGLASLFARRRRRSS
jgi:hypothetical protein